MTGSLTELAGLFLWSFLAATIFPVGSEPALVALTRAGERVWLLFALATLGNYLGACTTYGIARAAAARAAARMESRSGQRATRLLDRYGRPALLLSWVPLVGDAIVAAAGIVKTPFVPFSVYVVLGKAARYAVVIWAARETL
ncbi:MAG TPA: YqaA family protein [Thermoanaerobaculia bacterium]